MGARVAVGRRNLFSERRRGLLGIAGTAAALLLVLGVGAVYDGAMRRITRYIDTQPAQIFVAQEGVRNMHMASSSVPLSAAKTIEVVRGVTSVAPILYSEDALKTQDGRRLAYVIGYMLGSVGGPVDIASGRAPGPGEIVLDSATAGALGVGLGGSVEASGRSWRVSGLATELSNIANGVAFTRFEDFAAAQGLEGTASYLLVSVDGRPTEVAGAIERTTGLTATSREAFSLSERDLASDMIGGMLGLLTGAAWLVGFAVVALTLYAATRSRLRDIGVMKALGAGRGTLARLVLTQAAWTTGAALVVAAGLTIAAGALLDLTSSAVAMVLEPAAFLRAGALSAIVAAAASFTPLIKVSRVDPASVFRR